MIDLINPQLDSKFLDAWGEYLPFAIRSWLPILEAGCFVPRWIQAPLNALQYMTIGQYSSWSLEIPPGSFILEVMHSFQGAQPESPPVPYTSGQFSVQITDVGLQHEFFSQPLPDHFFYKKNINEGRNGHVLPKPYPVVSPGNFQFERWCTDTGRCELLFVVAVPKAVA